MPVQSFLCKLTFHHILGGDAGVVGAGHPEHIFSIHAPVSAEDVLEGIVEGMPHVQITGNIRWRDHNRIGGIAAVFVSSK